MGTNGIRARLPVGSELQLRPAELSNGLSSGVIPAGIHETEQKVEGHLERWGGRSAEYLTKANDAKELLVTLARTAQSVGERDKRNTGQFSKIPSRLRIIADLENLDQARALLVQEANQLKSCVDRRTEDGQSRVKQLQTEVSNYETKLKAAEDHVMRDELTGLSNRRNVEERMESRIAKGEPFCLVLLDPDNFKTVNRGHGRLAGDSLLNQVAKELRSSSRSIDIVGRWGGDELILPLECDPAGAKLQLERTKKWTFGEYKILPGDGVREVILNAARSTDPAERHPGERMRAVIEHAGQDTFANKAQPRDPKGE